MNIKQFKKIATWSTAALIVPFIGQLTVEGWNWTWHDFLFAWVFFNVLGAAYVFVTSNIQNRGRRMGAGLLVVAAFAVVWATLATG